MNVSIHLDSEQVNQLVFIELQQTRDCFMQDLETKSAGVFSLNDAYDKAQILKHIEAIDLILEWYRDPE